MKIPLTHLLLFTAWATSLLAGPLPDPVYPPDNVPTEAGVALGHRLFYDQILSRGNFLSCSNCHMPERAFADPRRMSVGVHGELTERTSMPLFNLAYAKRFFWDGRAPSLRAQALIPIENKVEMNERLENVVSKLSRRPPYPEMFHAAFGDGGITAERIGLALEQFQLTLISDQSKYDQVQSGEKEFSPSEQRGHDLFFATKIKDKPGSGASCASCHQAPFFTTHGFANNGIEDDEKDPGLQKVTGKTEDRGKFKIPSLRNVSVTKHYMHNSAFETLEEVVDYYNSGISERPHLDPRLAEFTGGLGLSAQQKLDLIAFLHTLTDHNFLTNPAFAEPSRRPR